MTATAKPAIYPEREYVTAGGCCHTAQMSVTSSANSLTMSIAFSKAPRQPTLPSSRWRVLRRSQREGRESGWLRPLRRFCSSGLTRSLNEAAGVHCAVCGAAAWPVAARAQQPMPVIGYLSARSAESDVTMLAASTEALAKSDTLRGGMSPIEFRWGDGHYDRLAGLAIDLARRQVADHRHQRRRSTLHWQPGPQLRASDRVAMWRGPGSCRPGSQFDPGPAVTSRC